MRSKLIKGIAEGLGLPWVHNVSNILPYLHLCCAESNGAVILCMYGKHTPELDTTLQEQACYFFRSSDYSKTRCQLSGWGRFYTPCYCWTWQWDKQLHVTKVIYFNCKSITDIHTYTYKHNLKPRPHQCLPQPQHYMPHAKVNEGS